MTIGLTITLGACSNNNSGNESSSESKIDKDKIQNMQGEWEADDSYPSTIKEDDDILTGTFTDTSLNATTDGGTDFTMTRP